MYIIKNLKLTNISALLETKSYNIYIQYYLSQFSNFDSSLINQYTISFEKVVSFLIASMYSSKLVRFISDIVIAPLPTTVKSIYKKL